MCVSANISVHVNILIHILVLWESILKIGVLFIMSLYEQLCHLIMYFDKTRLVCKFVC